LSTLKNICATHILIYKQKLKDMSRLRTVFEIAEIGKLRSMKAKKLVVILWILPGNKPIESRLQQKQNLFKFPDFLDL
jgi:hypothetical protein